MPTAAFINALAEECTKKEAIHFLQKQWDDNCRLRAALAAIKRASIEGRVCDDVAWFDSITTLHDYCDLILSQPKEGEK